jgi:hypothetical protein
LLIWNKKTFFTKFRWSRFFILVLRFLDLNRMIVIAVLSDFLLTLNPQLHIEWMHLILTKIGTCSWSNRRLRVGNTVSRIKNVLIGKETIFRNRWITHSVFADRWRNYTCAHIRILLVLIYIVQFLDWLPLFIFYYVCFWELTHKLFSLALHRH